MDKTPEFITLLEDDARSNRTVQLITIYKNIPLAFEARATSFFDGTAEYKVHPYQLAAAVLVKQVYIQSPDYPNCIRAQIVRMDPVRLILGCSDFLDAGNSLNRRVYVRVEPETSIPVFLTLGQARVRADLADISEEGISVYLDPAVIGGSDSEAQKFSSRFEINFHLPGDVYSPVKLQGAMRYGIRDTLSKRFRLGIQLFPDEDDRSLLSAFVKKRQAAALQEIKLLYERSLSGSGRRRA